MKQIKRIILVLMVSLLISITPNVFAGDENLTRWIAVTPEQLEALFIARDYDIILPEGTSILHCPMVQTIRYPAGLGGRFDNRRRSWHLPVTEEAEYFVSAVLLLKDENGACHSYEISIDEHTQNLIYTLKPHADTEIGPRL